MRQSVSVRPSSEPVWAGHAAEVVEMDCGDRCRAVDIAMSQNMMMMTMMGWGDVFWTRGDRSVGTSVCRRRGDGYYRRPCT